MIFAFLLLASSLVSAQAQTGAIETQRVRVSVLSLFHPVELRIGAMNNAELEIEVSGQVRTLARGSQAMVRRVDARKLEIHLEGEEESMRGDSVAVHQQSGTAAGQDFRFWLAVPGKLKRQYFGQLSMNARGAALEAVVSMPLETAVESVVQAESPPGAGPEALKAQAVAARSFLVARKTAHVGFDFCDTTHCQFLRSPPAPASAASRATRATQGLVLTWHDDATARDETVAAMYARSCGGRTRTLREIGVPAKGYPYYSVRCDWCRRHPERWQRQAASGGAGSERERLEFNRIHGWGALPGPADEDLNAQARPEVIHGRGVGHGVGLCQMGAAAMARRGASFRQILEHYYPDTSLAAAPPG